jgi:large subunit ribosomal protein L22
MKLITSSKYLRLSPKKTKFLVAGIKNLTPVDALSRLSITKEKSARLLSKVIKSAISNAVNNSKLSENMLVFASIEVGKGPFSKRWQPVARGMAHQIKKRTTHIKIILEEKKTENQIIKSGSGDADKKINNKVEKK